MKKLVSFLLFSSVCFFAFSQRTISTQGNKIVTACDEEIVMRGVNEMFIWSQDQQGTSTLPEIAKTGSNTVRLVWTTDGAVSDLDKLIENCLAQHMIPVPELHDATGDFTQLQKLLNYWKKPEVLEIIQKYKQWIIVNIGNEIGQGETNDQWEAYYIDAIDQLRDAGIDTPLMIDCGDYGSNEEYFLEKGQSLIDHDPLHNIIFAVHTYWIDPNSDQGRKDRLDSLISKAKAKDLPFIIGEGPQWAASPWSTYCEVEFPYEYLLQRCEEEGIGWLSWSWGLVDNNDCGAPNSVFDLTTDGTFGNWSTDFAEEIMITDVNSIQNTSVIPASMISGSCGAESCTPVELSASNQNACIDGTVTLTATLTTETSKSIFWYKNDELLADETSLVTTVDEAGVYRIEVDSANGKCVVFDDIVITKSIEVEIKGEPRICETSTTSLEIEVEHDAYDVVWMLNDEVLSHYDGVTQVDVDDVGEYKARVFTAHCSAEDTKEVTTALPSVKDTVICSDQEATLSISGDGAYAWYADQGLSNLLHSGSIYDVNQSTATTYYIRDENGFTGTVGKLEPGESVWDTWDAASKENKLGFEVFETMTIETMDVYTASAGELKVVFFNDDLTVNETKIYDAVNGKNVIAIDKEFTAGVYYASVAGSEVHVKFNHDEGNYTTAYPYTLMNGEKKIVSIDRTDEAWMAGKPWYLFFYNWTVNVASGAECMAVPMLVDVVDTCQTTNLNPTGESALSLYPNPTSGELTLSAVVSFELSNAFGEILVVNSSNKIDLSSYPSGIYFLKTETEQFTIVKQ